MNKQLTLSFSKLPSDNNLNNVKAQALLSLKEKIFINWGFIIQKANLSIISLLEGLIYHVLLKLSSEYELGEKILASLNVDQKPTITLSTNLQIPHFTNDLKTSNWCNNGYSHSGLTK